MTRATAGADSRTSWQRVRLKHLCTDAGQYGLSLPAGSYTATGRRLVRTSDIAEDGALRTDGSAVYLDPGLPLDPRHRLAPGDLLLSRSGTLGRTLLVPDRDAEHTAEHTAGHTSDGTADGIPDRVDGLDATYAGYLVRFRPRPHVDPRYLAYLATSTPFQDTVHAEAVHTTIANFNADRYANIVVDLPPLPEQRRIADHLDRVTARLRRLYDLRERQALLTRARLVNVLVSSLLTDVPADARPVRLKHLFDYDRAGVWGGEPTGSRDDVLCVRVADFDRGTFRAGADATTRRSVERGQLAGRLLRSGDVLLERSGGGEQSPVGFAVSYGRSGSVRAICSNFVSVLRPVAGCEPRYAALLMAAVYHAGRSLPFVKQSTGIQNLDTAAYLGQRVAVVDRRRQRAVAAALDAQIDQTVALTTLQRRQLAVLRERHRALVTAAVTGQLTPA